MDNLWKPTKQDRADLNHGAQKIRIGHLKADGLIEDDICPQCGDQVYRLTTKPGYLTLRGSKHKHKSKI